MSNLSPAVFSTTVPTEKGTNASPVDSEIASINMEYRSPIQPPPAARDPYGDFKLPSLSGSTEDLEYGAVESGAALPPPSHDDVPEGGFDAWLQVLGAWFVLACNWGLVNSFGVFQDYYERELLSSRSASDISWIGSLQGAILMVLGPIAGPLYDAGYFRHLVAVGLFLIVFGQMMVSLADQYWQMILAQGVCIGIGCGLTFLPVTAVLNQYFRRRRTLVFGIAATGSPVGGLIFPIIFGRLQPVIGFGWTTRVIAFIVLGASIMPVLYMRTRVPPLGKRKLVDWPAFREPAFALLTAGVFFAFLGLYIAFFYIEVFAKHFHLGSADFQPYFVSFLSVGSILGRIGPTYLGDRLGPINVMTVVSIFCAALAFAWIGVRTEGSLIGFALLYGCFSGTVASIAAPAVVVLTPDMGLVGTRMGMVFFMAGLAILVGSPVAGAILGDSADRGWTGVAAFSGSMLLVGSAGMGAARWFSWRQTGKLKG